MDNNLNPIDTNFVVDNNLYRELFESPGIKIINNFIDRSRFELLKKEMMSPLFDWYITGKVPNDETDFNFQFCHVFFNYRFEKSKYFNYLNPVLERLNPIAVNRIKANCVPKTETIQVSGLHVDINEERVIDSNPKTAIFYINTNNGYTLFEDGTKVESVENRICIFPYYMKHTGTTCTDKNQRVVININYTK